MLKNKEAKIKLNFQKENKKFNDENPIPLNETQKATRNCKDNLIMEGLIISS